MIKEGILLTARPLTAGGPDPHAFSAFWDIPSGSPKHSDPTMLHALTRIVFEQTSLRLTNVVNMSGTEPEPSSFGIGDAQRMRMLFMVEVAELAPMQLGNYPSLKNSGYGSQGLDVNSVPVVSSYGEHRQHVWSKEEDLKDFIDSGLYPAENRMQYRMMLEAFVFQKQNLAYLDFVNRQSQITGSSPGFQI